MSTTILGAGLAGLSTSWHLGHEKCVLFEKAPSHGGHAGSETRFGFTYDQGPHVSFTKHAYVRSLFEKNTGGRFHEFPVRVRNYFRGNWVEHPAQAHLWQVPEPLRSKCAKGMLSATCAENVIPPTNYREWLHRAYGVEFADTFPAAYTRKYWTVDPVLLSTDWLGPRMPILKEEEIRAGLQPGAYQSLHYVSRIRYPEKGGYQSFFEPLADGAAIRYGQQIVSVDLVKREVRCSDSSRHQYDKLVSTLPLPQFVNMCHQATAEVKEAAAALDCSQLLLVDVFVPAEVDVEGHWFYVYDEDKWSSRIHCIERLALSNAPDGWSGIQVEVYFSKHRPFPGDPDKIAHEVAQELVEMGFFKASLLQTKEKDCLIGWRWSPYANVIFTHPRRQALEAIWDWLEPFGLMREEDDLEAMSDWSCEIGTGSIVMAGRFAQWKYFWTDDCVLRGQWVAKSMINSDTRPHI